MPFQCLSRFDSFTHLEYTFSAFVCSYSHGGVASASPRNTCLQTNLLALHGGNHTFLVSFRILSFLVFFLSFSLFSFVVLLLLLVFFSFFFSAQEKKGNNQLVCVYREYFVSYRGAIEHSPSSRSTEQRWRCGCPKVCFINSAVDSEASTLKY